MIDDLSGIFIFVYFIIYNWFKFYFNSQKDSNNNNNFVLGFFGLRGLKSK